MEGVGTRLEAASTNPPQRHKSAVVRCRCVCSLRVCVCFPCSRTAAGVRKRLTWAPAPNCKFLDGRQTRPILIALGSARWLFQLLSPDTVPLNVSSAEINYAVPPAPAGCSAAGSGAAQIMQQAVVRAPLFYVGAILAFIWCYINWRCSMSPAQTAVYTHSSS